MDITNGYLQWPTNFFDNKSIGRGIKNEIKQKQQLVNELHKAIISELKKSSFKDNIWGVDSVDMQLIKRYNNGTKYLLCAILIYLVNMHGLFL